MPDSEKKLKRAVIKEELVALTGDWLKAVILQQFLYWGERVSDFDAFILEERLRKNEPDIELTHGWIWKSAKELKDEIMVTPLSEDTVRRRMAELVESGWLEERNNPYHRWDRTLQYRPSIQRIQRDLQALGYALEHYPLLIENFPIPHRAESNPHNAESRPDSAESNLDGAAAIPETPIKTTPENTSDKDSLSLREQAKRGEMTPETEMALLAEYGRQGKAGVADPSQDEAQWFKYREEIINVFVENGGDLGKKMNQQQPRKDAILNFAATQDEFDMERWRNSVHTAVIIGGVNGANLSCIFETYLNGGNYQEMWKKRKNGGNSHAAHRRSSRSVRPGNATAARSSLTEEQREKLGIEK